MDGLLSKLKSLDAYPKVNEDFFQRTLSGGIITIGSSLIMLCLFLSELSLFMKVNTTNELSVDLSRGDQLQINFDITFPGLPCEWMSLDLMDISGEMHLDVDHDVYKRRLDQNGVVIPDSEEKHQVGPEQDDKLLHKHNETECGSCYGAAPDEECCNSCDEVRAAYRRKGWGFTDPQQISQCAKEGYVEKLRAQEGEGCHMWGSLAVNKVAGNFHFAPGKSFQNGPVHVHDLVPFRGKTFDTSHTIKKLSFGHEYPGMRNPLDGTRVAKPTPADVLGGARPHNSGAYQYFLKVVPTTYVDKHNKTIASNQYSVTEHFKPMVDPDSPQSQLPGVFFFYDLSPIKVKYTETKMSFLHFLTSVCAIIGGIFTVAGIVDAFIYHGSQAIRKKVDLGKQI